MLAEPKPLSQDEEIILSIKRANKDKNKLVQKLIDDHHGFIHKLKLETGLSEIELKDIYTDTVLLVLQHIENDTFKGESKLSTYFFRIFYFKTVDYLRKVSANKIDYTGDLPDQDDAAQNVTSQIEVRDEMSQIVRLLDKMCAPCRQIIMDWAYWGYKPDEIGERIGERDPVKFSKMKYNCVEKFKKLWNKRMRLA